MAKKNQINFKNILATNILGGMAWGLGATVGLAVIFAILGFILNRLDLVPIVGSFISDILGPVLQNNPQLIK
jgi:nitrate reductase gamma subunit